MNLTTKNTGRAAGLSSGVILVWLWGLAFPDQPMPPEVAAGLSGLLMGLWALVEKRVG